MEVYRRTRASTGTYPEFGRHRSMLRFRRHIAVLLLTFMVPGSILFAEAGGTSESASPPRAVHGLLDLRHWNLDAHPVSLNGQWQFYWKDFLPVSAQTSYPAPTGYADVPEPWTGALDNRQLPAFGYGTYRLRVELPRTGMHLTLRIDEVRTSYTCFVDGEEVARLGSVGTSRKTETAELAVRTATFTNHRKQIDIVIQVANFYHRNPGITGRVWLGEGPALEVARQKLLNFDFLLIGAFLVMGLYHVGLFMLRRQDRSSLLFGLFCLITVLRIFVTGEHAHQPFLSFLSWEGMEKIEFLTLSIGFGVFFLYSYELFYKEFDQRTRVVAVSVSAAYSILILITRNIVYGRVLIAFQVFIMVAAIYLFRVLIASIQRRRVGAVIFLAGYIIFFAGVLNDILATNYLVGTPQLFPYALFIFILFQAILIARRFSRVYRRVEYLTRMQGRLRNANENLRELSYVDALTSVANRRHFDQFMREEWARAVRNGGAMSVLMVDIDSFKSYNDNYGHQAGDEVLRKVAAAISGSTRRSVDFLARYGGEEFVFVLPNTAQRGAARVAEKVRESVENLAIPHEYSDTAPFVTISVGTATMFPNQDLLPAMLVDRADRALYRAKQAGKNQVVAGI